jgi:hypothetical protein
MKSLKAAWDAVWVAATFAEAGEWRMAQELGREIVQDREEQRDERKQQQDRPARRRMQVR